MYAVFQASAVAAKPKSKRGEIIEALRALKPGQAIAVPFDDVGEATLRNIASQFGRESDRQFRVIKHADTSVFEVAYVGERVGMPENPQ